MAGGRALLSGPRSWCELLLARRFGIQNEKRNVTLCSQNGRWMTENSLPKRSSQSQDQRSTLSNIAALVGAGAMGFGEAIRCIRRFVPHVMPCHL